MNKKLLNYAAFALMFLTPSADIKAQIAQGGQYTLKQSVVAGGGEQNSSGGAFSLDGAIGQPITEKSSSQNFTISSGFFTAGALIPTAANASVSGRVRTADGSGIRNARITLTTADGMAYMTLTASFGYYRFDNIPAGQIVILSVSSKRFIFYQPTRVLNVNDEISDIDFIANEQIEH